MTNNVKSNVLKINIQILQLRIQSPIQGLNQNQSTNLLLDFKPKRMR